MKQFLCSSALLLAAFVGAQSAVVDAKKVTGTIRSLQLSAGPIPPIHRDALTDLGLNLLGTSAFGDLSGKVPAPGSIAGSFDFGKLPRATIGVDITYASAFISSARFVAVTNADPAKIR